MQNKLLAALPAQEIETLNQHLEPVALRAGEHLLRADEQTQSLYFLGDAVVTLSVGAERGQRAGEITTVGCEGIVGFPQALVNTPSGVEAVVRIAGTAQRIATPRFRDALSQLPALRGLLDQYAHSLMLQLARAALCERRHSIEQRLSTLILLTHDRTGGANMQLTHEQLGDMLGVRRAGVTEVATKLRSQSAIDYRRGRLNVNDRDHLLQAACGCYEAIRGQFQQSGDSVSA
jgi:CRP-like cAMP-binding protein